MKKYTGIKLLATGVLAGVIATSNQQIVHADEDQSLDNQRVHLEDTLKSITKIKSDLAELKQQKEKMIEHLVILEKRSAEAKIVLNEEMNNFADENAKYEEIQKEHSTKLQKLEQLKEEISQLNKSLSEKKSELEEAKHNLSNLTSNQKKELSESDKKKLEEIEGRKKYYSRELASGIKLITEYQERIEYDKKLIAETALKIAQMEKEGRTKEFDYKKALDIKDSRTKDLESKQRTVDNKKIAISRYELELKSIEVEIEAINQNAPSPEIEEKINSKQQEVSSLEKIISTMQEKLTDRENESKQLATEIEKQSDKPSDDRLQEAKKLLDNIESEIQANKQNLSDLDQQIDELSKDLEQKNSSAKDLNEKIKNLEEQKKEIAENIKQIDNTYDKFTEKQKVIDQKDSPQNNGYRVRLKLTYQPKEKTSQNYEFKIKDKHFYVKVDNQWKKINQDEIKHYLNNKKSKFQTKARIKTKKKKLQLVNTNGKKVKKYVRNNQKIKIQGMKLIKNKIYVYVSGKNLLLINNVRF